MPQNTAPLSTLDRLLPTIGGALSILVSVLQGYFLYTSFALIIEFGYYELIKENLVLMSAQLCSVLLAMVGGAAVIARLHWGWPLAVGAAGFQLAMFTQLAVMFGFTAMTASFDSTGYLVLNALMFSAALIIILSLRPSTQQLRTTAKHVFAGMGIATLLLILWNSLQP